MDIKLNQLAAKLSITIPKIMLVSGDETVLCDQAHSIIRSQSNKLGYNHRQKFDLEQQWSWQELKIILQQQDLFATKTLIEIYNPNSKFDANSSKTILEAIPLIPDDKKIMISCGKITPSQAKSKWYKAISGSGLTMRLWPLNNVETSTWLQSRLKEEKIKLAPELVQQIIFFTNGNLTDIKQIINKLSLYSNHEINAELINNLLTNHSQLNVFQLTDAILDNNLAKVISLSTSLDNIDNKDLILLNWALGQMLQRLLLEQQGKQNYIPLRSMQIRIRQAATRLSQQQLLQALQHTARFDKILKGCIIEDTKQPNTISHIANDMHQLIIKLATATKKTIRANNYD